MNATRVLVDTGPLVAVFSPSDAHHATCVKQLHEIRPPLFTCWPVITEAAWLLRQRPASIQQLLACFDTGIFRLLTLGDEAPAWIARFLERYRQIGAQVADAALVYLAERDGMETVFTLDRRDFLIYRLSRNRTLRLLPPP